jgi:hypothetical protein
MRTRRKLMRIKDGSVYRLRTKREFWKSQTMKSNRRIQSSNDWTIQKVWLKDKAKENNMGSGQFSSDRSSLKK